MSYQKPSEPDLEGCDRVRIYVDVYGKGADIYKLTYLIEKVNSEEVVSSSSYIDNSVSPASPLAPLSLPDRIYVFFTALALTIKDFL